VYLKLKYSRINNLYNSYFWCAMFEDCLGCIKYSVICRVFHVLIF